MKEKKEKRRVLLDPDLPEIQLEVAAVNDQARGNVLVDPNHKETMLVVQGWEFKLVTGGYSCGDAWVARKETVGISGVKVMLTLRVWRLPEGQITDTSPDMRYQARLATDSGLAWPVQSIQVESHSLVSVIEWALLTAADNPSFRSIKIPGIKYATEGYLARLVPKPRAKKKG